MSLSKEEQDLVDTAPMNELESEIASNMNWFLERLFTWPQGRMQMRVKMLGREVNGVHRSCALKYNASPPLSDAELLACSKAIMDMTEELSSIGRKLEEQGLGMAVDFSPEGAEAAGGGMAAKITVCSPKGTPQEEIDKKVRESGLKLKPILNKKDLN